MILVKNYIDGTFRLLNSQVSIGFINSESYKYYRNMKFRLVRKITTLQKTTVFIDKIIENNNKYLL